MTMERVVILAETVVIAFLGFWISQEYMNNVYLRDYVAGFWAINWWVAPATVAALVIVGVIAYYMGVGTEEMEEEPDKRSKASIQREILTNSGMVVMDVCPFCNLPLRSVGEDRFQCRKCKRYYKH